MARAGAGRSGGSRSHSSHRSSSRSSGSHRVSSSRSSRPSSISRSSRPSGGYSRPTSPSYQRTYSRGDVLRDKPNYNHKPRHTYLNTGNPVRDTYVPGRESYYVERNSSNNNNGNGSCLVTATLLFLALFVIVVFGSALIGAASRLNSDVTQSTVNRTKLESGLGYVNECIVDELGWFDNINQTSRELQSFYDKTGIQPYIVLLDYNPSLSSDVEKEGYANAYFEEHELNENGFLFIYFAEESTDEDVGLMCYVNGHMASTVMDSEAVEIFWNYTDRYWYTDMSTDDMFISIFRETADVIMEVSTTKEDVSVWMLITVIVTVALVSIVVIIANFNKKSVEKAKIDAEILNAPLECMSSGDDLVNKYLD